MSLELSCPTCSKPMLLADSAAGHVILCPRCGRRLKLESEEQRVEFRRRVDNEEYIKVTGFDDEVRRPQPGKSGRFPRCPVCKNMMAKEAIVCIRCGYDRQVTPAAQQRVTFADEKAKVGSQLAGAWTEITFRHDENDGWVLIFDSWENSRSASYVKVVLKDYKEACIGYFVTGIDSGTLTIILNDFYGRRRLVYSGDGEAQQWIIDRLHKAGLRIIRE